MSAGGQPRGYVAGLPMARIGPISRSMCASDIRPDMSQQSLTDGSLEQEGGMGLLHQLRPIRGARFKQQQLPRIYGPLIEHQSG
jgi:hypothetical protein